MPAKEEENIFIHAECGVNSIVAVLELRAFRRLPPAAREDRPAHEFVLIPALGRKGNSSANSVVVGVSGRTYQLEKG
jgi:hypothetical protein